MNTLYHVSKVANLEVLEPRKSTHGKPYVYATDNYVLALFFGSPKSYGDFDGLYGVQDGIPYFYEAYKGAFKRRFENVSCYVYEVEPDTFQKGLTSFKAEVVSTLPVKTISCKKIDDLYEELLKCIKDEKIKFHEFSEDEEYRKMIFNHIKSRIEMTQLYKHKDSFLYKWCEETNPQILAQVEKEHICETDL